MMSSSAVEVQLQRPVVKPDERRRERRYYIPHPPSVEIRIPPQTEIIEAEVVNVSKNGIGLVSRDYITPGLQIMFTFGDQYVFARVRHCQPIENGFAIGAAIRDMALSH